MNDLTRLRTLAGTYSYMPTVTMLEAQKQALIKAHDHAIKQVIAGVPLDEGLFTALAAAVGTVKHGTKKAVEKVKDVGTKVHDVYKIEHGKAELKTLYKLMGNIIKDFEYAERSTKTIIKDPDVKSAFTSFSDALGLFVKDLKSKMSSLDIKFNEAEDEVLSDDELALFESFMGAYNKEKWVTEHLKAIDFTKHRDLVMHVLAAKLSFTELKAFKKQAEQPEHEEDKTVDDKKDKTSILGRHFKTIA